MAFDAMKTKTSLKTYIEEVRSIWREGRDPELPFQVKGLLEKFLASINPQESWIARLMERGLPAEELYRDKDYGFIQMGHVHEKGHTTLPHDHGPCWVLYGVYHGAAEIATYRRVDHGNVPGRAELKKKEIHRLTAGVGIPCLSGEIHSARTLEHSVVFCFLSHDLNKVRKHHYDLEKGIVQPLYGTPTEALGSPRRA